MRQDVWLREIEAYVVGRRVLRASIRAISNCSLSSLQNQGSPTTLIAVCGATGAGKSSILNAILDGKYLLTSRVRP